MLIGSGKSTFAARVRGRARMRPVSKIPNSSMADIAFLLVVFFALLANEPDRTRVELPDSMVQVAAEEDAALVVVAFETVAESEVEPAAPELIYKFSDGQKESVAAAGPEVLGQMAGELLADDPNRQFRIKADAQAPCRDIGETLDALTRAGARQIVMVTRPSKADQEGQTP